MNTKNVIGKIKKTIENFVPKSDTIGRNQLPNNLTNDQTLGLKELKKNILSLFTGKIRSNNISFENNKNWLQEAFNLVLEHNSSNNNIRDYVFQNLTEEMKKNQIDRLDFLVNKNVSHYLDVEGFLESIKEDNTVFLKKIICNALNEGKLKDALKLIKEIKKSFSIEEAIEVLKIVIEKDSEGWDLEEFLDCFDISKLTDASDLIRHAITNKRWNGVTALIQRNTKCAPVFMEGIYSECYKIIQENKENNNNTFKIDNMCLDSLKKVLTEKGIKIIVPELKTDKKEELFNGDTGDQNVNTQEWAKKEEKEDTNLKKRKLNVYKDPDSLKNKEQEEQKVTKKLKIVHEGKENEFIQVGFKSSNENNNQVDVDSDLLCYEKI